MRRLTAWVRGWFVARVETPLATLLDPGFVAIDVETTGLDPRRDAVVSLAAIPFVHGQPTQGFVTLVDPGRAIPPASTRIHGIDDRRVRGAPSIADVLPNVDDALAGRIVVGHDVAFDLTVLAHARRVLSRAEPGCIALDTHRLAVALHPSWRRHAELESLAERLGIGVVGRHTADGDACLAGRILMALLPQFRARGVRTIGDLLWAQTAVYRRV
jgi:DNA polymerase III epsilon subunit family exonuclease